VLLVTVTVFLGPSLALRDAQSILPDATYRPPAAQGDLLAAVEQDACDLIGLIDGTFHQSLSVWHNEVCYLLSRGIAIFGASSMGALRAVETERFGTVGVGTVFRWYRDGVVLGDDEVALLHGDADVGYPNLSLPLVNIRGTVLNAVQVGLLDQRAADALVAIAGNIYYPERQLPRILSECRAGGFSGDELQAVAAALTHGYVDVKRADACELLHTIRDVVSGNAPRPPVVEFTFGRSSVFEALYNQDRAIRVDGREVRLRSVMEHAALHDAEFGDVYAAALNRDIVGYLGVLLGIQLDPKDVEKEDASFRRERGITCPEEMRDWLAVNAMSYRDYSEYISQEAMCARMRRWMVSNRGFDRGVRPVLNELRRRGQFEHWASVSAEEQAVVDSYAHLPECKELELEHPRRLASMHAANSGVRIEGDVKQWADGAGFEDVVALEEALYRAVLYQGVKSQIAAHLKELRLVP
jgi:hypothetical protein